VLQAGELEQAFRNQMRPVRSTSTASVWAKYNLRNTRTSASVAGDWSSFSASRSSPAANRSTGTGPDRAVTKSRGRLAEQLADALGQSQRFFRRACAGACGQQHGLCLRLGGYAFLCCHRPFGDW